MSGNALVALKHATENTATVFYRDNGSGGVLTASCNGQTFTGETLSPSSRDGSGLVTITGLTGGNSYPFTLALDGVQVYSGALKTAPVAGSTWTYGFGSCFKYNRPSTALTALIERFGNQLRGFNFQGDIPYLDDGLTSNFSFKGETIKDLGAVLIGSPGDDGTIINPNIYAHHRLYWSLDGVKEMMRAVPCHFVPSDHDIGPGDNVGLALSDANLISAVNAYNVWCDTAAHAKAVVGYCQSAIRQTYWRGNPSNADANNQAGWAADEQTYFAFDWGDATLIFCDHATNADWSSVYTGTAQTQWIKDTLSASTKTWKLIFIGGAMSEFTTNKTTQAPELKGISDYITVNDITGVSILTGDLHSPAVFNDGTLVTVRACPAGQTPHTNLTDDYGPTTTAPGWKWQGYKSNGTSIPDIMHVAGYVTVHGSSYMEIGIMTDTGDDLIPPMRIDAGTNAVTVRRTRMG